MIVFAIDQSTGASSAVGVAVLSGQLEILATFALMPRKKYVVVEKRLIDLHQQLEQQLAPYIAFAIENQMRMDVVFEQFHMAGLTGFSLANAVGAFVASFPQHELIKFDSVNNKSMKLFIAGDGKANKIDVAKGLIKHLPTSEHDTLIKLMNSNNYDALDAIGLAITHIKRGAKKHGKKA